MVTTLEAVNLLLVGQTLLSVFLAALFWSFHYGLKRHRFFYWWAWAWTALALRLLIGLAAHGSFSASVQGLIEFLSIIAAFVLIPLLVFGARSIRQGADMTVSRYWLKALGGAAVLGALNYLWAAGITDPRIAILLRLVPRQLITGVALVYCGTELLRFLRRTRSPAAGVTALAWTLWGVGKIAYASIGLSALLQRTWQLGFLPLEYRAAMDLRMSLFDTAFQIVIALAMLFLLLDERQRAEADLAASEDRLRRSEERFRLLIEKSSDIITVLDAGGTLVYASPSSRELLGYTESELLGQVAFDFMHPDDRERVAATFAGGVAVPDFEALVTLRFRCKDGTYRTLEAVGKNLLGDPAVAGVVITARDITERLGAEEALRASDERYRTFIRNSSEGIWREEVVPPLDITRPVEEQVDHLLAHSRFAEVNDAMARMYGVQTGDELIGRPLGTSLGDDPFNRHYLRRFVVEGYRAIDFETHERDRDGQMRIFINNVTGVVRDGHLVASWGTQRDITRRRQAEEALAEQRQFLRQVLDINPNFILARDRDGRFRLGNAATASAYGTTVEGLIGKTDLDFPQDPAQVAHFLAQDREVLETGRELFVPEEFVVDATGTSRWVQVSKRPIRSRDGRSDMVLIVTTDITERKKAEEARDKIFTLSLDMLATADERGYFTCVNPAFERTLGYPEEELLSRPYLDFVHADDREATTRAFAVLMGGEPVVGFENRYRCRDGSYRWLSWSCTPPANGVLYAVARDVTEQKRLDEIRAFERDLWHNLMDNIPDTIFFKDTASRFTRVNRAHARLLGVADPADAIGRTDGDFFDPEQAREALADDEHIVRTGEPMIGKLERLRTPQGDVHWFYSTKVAVRDRQDRIIGIVGSSRKMTDLVNAQEALRASEERFRALYDDNPSMYFTVEPDGTVRSVNRTGAEQLGYAPGELEGRSVLRVFHPQDREAATRHVQDCLGQPGRVHEWELRKIRKDGSELWVRESARAVRRADGSMVVLVVCEDITQSKRVEAEQGRLRADVERAAREWRHTFDAIGSPVLILDHAGAVTRLNDAARRLAGKDYDGILGARVGEVGTAQPWPRAADLVATVRARHAGAAVQARDEATGRVWDVSASPMTVNAGAEEHIIIVAHDITPLVRLQESLRRSETMSAMGSLVAGVAHEVRNPLFSMTATLDAFEARYGVRKEYQKHLGVLRSQLDRLTRLMQELLEYGKPPSLDIAPDSIESVIAQAIEACAMPARQGKVKFARRLDRSLPPLAMDRMRLVQLFANLFENAVQHSPAGGTVTVTAHAVGGAGDARWLECAVLDGGSGLAPEDIPRIFEPFFTRRRGGTGLGLSLVQRIAEQHGGTVIAGNRPEGGAEVRVRLPLAGVPS